MEKPGFTWKKLGITWNVLEKYGITWNDLELKYVKFRPMQIQEKRYLVYEFEK